MQTDDFILLRLGKGNLESGFPDVSAELWTTGKPPKRQSASLPAAPEIAQTDARWRLLYEALCEAVWDVRLEVTEWGVTQVSTQEFLSLCQGLQQHINQWLCSEPFQPIYRFLHRNCLADVAGRLVIETDDLALRRLPWHLWDFVQEDYPRLEVVLGSSHWEVVDPVCLPREKVRVLAIFGHSAGLNVAQEKALLNGLANAEVVVLVEPSRQRLNQILWDKQGWDILFFAGHSYTQAETGWLALNPKVSLSLEQIRYGLRAAIANGLKIAIFNSCDGLGLAHHLEDLHIPQVIVMREPVPDLAAQAFFRQFLTTFAQGEAIHQAVRKAREQLQGLEEQFPCASWLPVLCQNPTVAPLTWATLSPPRPRRIWAKILMFCVLVTSLVMGVRWLGLLEAWELALLDHLLRSQPAETIDARILVIEITEADTLQYSYPPSDAVVANLIEALLPHQPRAIGLDLHRQQPREPGRQDLIKLFEQQKQLLLVCSQVGAQGFYHPPSELSAQQRIRQAGFSDLLVDPAN